ncbi:M61 family metallopeptidase [Flavihumibacter sp. R14]|nr:M61 family metallopeptidase [Flavihumibacter soli]
MKSVFKSLILALIMSAVSTVAKAQSKIAFEVSFTEPQAHYVDVEMVITGNKKDQLDIKMPAWAPGSYLIREFAKNVEEFSAAGSKGALPVEKTNKNTWRISTGKSSEVKIKYRVYAFEISVRTSFVDDSHAFLSPTGIFMYPAGQIKESSTVKINLAKGWSKISTGLENVKGKSHTYYSPDFDVLYDSPIEVGSQDVFEFTASGVKHEVAMVGGGNYDKDRLKKDMARIVEEETSIFGVNPNKRYVFIVHNYSAGGGGLEHFNSTVLGASRFGYANENSYQGFLGLVAHEYFHLWNVKRLRPVALGPFDYDNENYTSNLWIAEGFTAYYDNLMLRRADFHSPERYLNVLAGEINLVENQPGNRVQAVSDASFDAWIKQYRPNENSKNSGISYYNKGALVAMVMDLEIINATRGAKGLDDVMKAMYDEYYTRQDRGYTDAEFKSMAEKIAGKSFDKIYNDYVNGTKVIDYTQILGYAGLALENTAGQKSEPYIGATTSGRDGKITINNVSRNSPAWISGLNVNDEIIAIDGFRVTDLEKMISLKKAGDKITVLISRDGVLKNIELNLEKNQALKYRIIAVEDPTSLQLKVRSKWLKLSDTDKDS